MAAARATGAAGNGHRRRARFFGEGLPGLGDLAYPGTLVVVEGPDGSGRTTITDRLAVDLEARGHAVTVTGLKRSILVSPGIIGAKRTLLAERRTMTLYYAADFADQLENRIIPSLRAGYVVLCDRYVYTLMARGIVRGMDTGWLQSLFSIALVPDVVLYLRVPPEQLLERVLRKDGSLDYWESGVDLGLSLDIVESFIEYQRRLQAVFGKLGDEYGFIPVEAGGAVDGYYPRVRNAVLDVLDGRHAPATGTLPSPPVRSSLRRKAGRR